MTACQTRHYELAKLLLDSGANFDAVHSDGSTPWTFVVKTNEAGLADYMLQKGANPNAPVEGVMSHDDVASVLWLACLSGSCEVAKKLIDGGADVKVLANNVSILHIACQAEHFGIAQYLIHKNYKLEFLDAPYLRLPLFAACISNRPEAVEVVEEMITRGVPFNCTRESLYIKPGYSASRIISTPLHLAIQYNAVRVVWTLVSLGGYSVASFPYVNGDETISPFDMCKYDRSMTAALYNEWNQRNHLLFPKPVRDAIFNLLLVNKRKQFYMPDIILYKIFTYIAYGWLPPTHPAMQPLVLDDRIQSINCQGSLKGIPSTIQGNASQLTVVT